MPEDSFVIATIDSADAQRVLDQVGPDKMRRIVQIAMREGAKVEQEIITRRVPVATNEPDKGSNALPRGAMQSDVVIKPLKSSDGFPGYSVTFGKYTQHIARFVDGGHRIAKGGRLSSFRRGKFYAGKGDHVGDVEPHPFFAAAAAAGINPSLKAISNSLEEQVNRIDKK